MQDRVQVWLENSTRLLQVIDESMQANTEEELRKRQDLALDYQDQPELQFTFADIVGTYRILGQNPDNSSSSYIGTLEITEEEGKLLATWYIAGAMHYAYGMQVSPRIFVFNFIYFDKAKMPSSGIVAYTFLSENIVEGRWIENGFAGKGIEELRRCDEEVDLEDMEEYLDYLEDLYDDEDDEDDDYYQFSLN